MVCLVRRSAAGAWADRDAVRQSAARFRASFQGLVRDCLWATGAKARQGARRKRQMLRLDVHRQAGFQSGLSDAGPKAPVAARSTLHLADPLTRADELV